MTLHRYVFPFALFLVAVLLAAQGRAEGWGNLTGRFLYDGPAPERVPIKITKDQDYCGKCELYEEDLVVDPKTSGVANVIVWLYAFRRGPQPPVHDSYAETAVATVPLDSDKCRIEPHVCLLRTSQGLLIRNTDPIGDGLKIDTMINVPINIVLKENDEVTRRFPKPEKMPVRVSCPIHPWESGWLLVLEHPYMAVSDTDGRFEIKNLPTGVWTFLFWQEKAGYVDKVKLDGSPVTWKRGRLELEIKEGTNDLGTIVLAPTLFNK